jgi:hypothetical protein
VNAKQSTGGSRTHGTIVRAAPPYWAVTRLATPEGERDNSTPNV